jgi:hypothetical protein
MLRVLYLLFGLFVVGGYAYVSWKGLELTGTKKQQLSPQGMRGTTGGAVFYRGGYRGGK